MSGHCKGRWYALYILIYAYTELMVGFESKCTPLSLSLRSMPMNERDLHFLKMAWKIFALFLSNVPHWNRYSMHLSDLTENLGYFSPVRRYWGFKSCPQFVPLKIVLGKLIHAHALGGFDVPNISWIRLSLVSFWSPKVVLSRQCVEICMLEMRQLKDQKTFCNLSNQINGKCVNMVVSATNFAMSNSDSKCPQISSYVWSAPNMCIVLLLIMPLRVQAILY